MAKRTKKETALTLEEKLQQALVPVEEQPYPVPENWCWTRLDNISEIVTGGTPSKKHPEYYGGSFPFFLTGITPTFNLSATAVPNKKPLASGKTK